MKVINIFVLTGILLFIWYCSDNPFFGSEQIDQRNLTLKGKVTLQDEDDYSNIFIWLRGLNRKTRTNEDGSFALDLQNPNTLPGEAQAWTGEFPLYYYVNNFKIDSVMITILNGEIKQDQANVTNKGRIKVDKELRKVINITTTCVPSSIGSVDSALITVNLEVRQMGNGSTLFTYKDREDSLKAFFIYKTDEPLNVWEHYYKPPGLPQKVFIKKTLYGTHTFKVKMDKGTYKIVPFVHLAQTGIPSDMFIEIGEYPDRFVTDGNHKHGEFLKMPIKVDGQILVVN